MQDDTRKKLVEYLTDVAFSKDSPRHHRIARSRAALQRVAGSNSPYEQELDRILANSSPNAPVTETAAKQCVLALLEDIEGGHLTTVEELIHAEVFSDFLEMATHLLDNGYKDPAAVIAGTALESHLRLLCPKHNVDVTRLGKKGPMPKAAEAMNVDLRKADGYNTNEQQQITAWLGIRNDAAHGNYDEYDPDQVALMIEGIRDFMARHPA